MLRATEAAQGGPRALILGLACLLLMSCSSRGPAPVAERGIADPPRSGYHRVREGDTLYSIAWRYGVDWDLLARRNRIAAPFTIFPGQRLRILGEAPAAPAPSRSRPAPTVTAAPDAGSDVARAETAPARRASPAVTGPLRWAWPLQGEIVDGYRIRGATINKGIDIRGAPGALVRAAASGQVVYAGTGLRGHSQLVIVKHDDTWLSAYAHDDEILVREGQVVAAGDQVARLNARSEAPRVLHFEIRRQGKPVDPADLLPGR